MSKGMAYLGYMVLNRGTSVPVSTGQTDQKWTVLPFRLRSALQSHDDAVLALMDAGHVER
jgi:hypothetical protein